MTTKRSQLWAVTAQAMDEAEVILQARRKAEAAVTAAKSDIDMTIRALAKASRKTAAPPEKREQMLADTAAAMAEAEMLL